MSKLYPTLLLSIFLSSCSFDDGAIDYEEKLTVWANLQANMPLLDTVFVSRSARLQENVNADALWLDDAQVIISGDSVNLTLHAVEGRPGRYMDDSFYFFKPGVSYQLTVIHGADTVRATTLIPEKMNIQSVQAEPFECQGNSYPIKSVNLNNISTSLDSFGVTGNIDTVYYRKGECFTESFASYPLFVVDFNQEDYQTVRIISYALDADSVGLEPEGWDYNGNLIRDSVFVNLIYDTTNVFRLWKGPYLRTAKNVPYRYNPWTWNVETTPVNMSWLFFDYYGLHLITFQATDEAFYNYLSGDPAGLNNYVLPESNVEDGYGLFSSSYSTYFMVYIAPYEEN